MSPGRRRDHSIGPGKGAMPKPPVRSSGFGTKKAGCLSMVPAVVVALIGLLFLRRSDATAETPKPFPVQECLSCKKPVIWTRTERGGKPMPVDADPTGDGNVALRWAPDGTITAWIPKPHLAFGRRDLRKSHFATCKDAGTWRRRDGGRR